MGAASGGTVMGELLERAPDLDGVFVNSDLMAIAAIFGGMNTMYAAVGSRTREIATLRALGFSRGSILASFLVEALILGCLGGIVGGLAAAGYSPDEIEAIFNEFGKANPRKFSGSMPGNEPPKV